jgi:hypothetical protein
VRHAAPKSEACFAAHDDDTAAFALADDEFRADIQPHLGHPAVKTRPSSQGDYEDVTTFISHAEGK